MLRAGLSRAKMTLDISTKMHLSPEPTIQVPSRQELDELCKTQQVVKDVAIINDKTLTQYCAKDPDHPETAHIRSILYHEDELVSCGGMHSIKEVISPETTSVSCKEELSDCIILKAIEGTIIQVRNFDDTWLVSTNRKINADESRWGTEETFGALFRRAIANVGLDYDAWIATLKKELQYTFIMTTTEKTKFVCKEGPLTVYLYMITANAGSRYIFPTEEWKEWLQPQMIMTYPGIIKYCKKLKQPFTHAGLLCLNVRTMKSYKFVNSEYEELFQLVKPHLSDYKYVYLHYMNDIEKAMKFVELHADNPKTLQELKKINEGFNQLVDILYQSYRRRYIYKEDFIVSHEMNWLLAQIHRRHRETRAPTTKSIIRQVIAADPLTLGKILNPYKHRYQKN